MAESKAFVPNSVGFATSSAGLELSFTSDDGKTAAVLLLQPQIQTLVARLSKEIESSALTPIDRNSLRPGQDFLVAGFSVDKNTDGRRRLVLLVELPDQGRTVTIPLTLSPDEARDIIKMLA